MCEQGKTDGGSDMAKKKAQKWAFNFMPRVAQSLDASCGPGGMTAYTGASEAPSIAVVDAGGNSIYLENTTQAAWLRDLCQAIIDNGALPEAE